MTQLVPIQLDDGMMLYIEAQDNTESPITFSETDLEQRRTGQKGLPTFNAPRINPTQSMQLMQNTIRTYAYYCMNAFKNCGVANVDEVTLEFGVNLSADAGVPYIASGKAQSSLKITVKCTYPKSEAVSANGLVVGQEGTQN